MRILVGKTFGLGNAVMAIPMLRALTTLGSVDVLVGSSGDDVGALDVMLAFRQTFRSIGLIYIDRAPLDVEYDVAVMAIPFDGRWQNGVHFRSKRVMDGRPRPGDPNVIGLESWKKHETLYQMDDAVELGYTGSVPEQRFLEGPSTVDHDLVYLGIGFKRDALGFWSKKHWGNDRFVGFVEEVRRLRPGTKFTATGGQGDLPVIVDINRRARVNFGILPIRESFKDVMGAHAYFGNDTGMAHVAASLEKPVYTMMAFMGSEIKNPPRCARSRWEHFQDLARAPELVAKDFVEFAW